MKKLLFILVHFIGTSNFAQVNLNLGLVAHHPFSGNANDAGPNGINGTIVNATFTTDRTGTPNSACYFNGSNAYIELPYSTQYNFAPSGSFTISVWVLPDQNNSWPAQAVVVKSPPNPDFTFSTWNYGIYVFNYQAMTGFAYNHVLTGTTTFVQNRCWYHILSTYSNGIWHLYVNGRLESSNTNQTSFILQDGSSKIAYGRKGQSSGDWFKGKIDEVRIYNRVLNQLEIDSLSYNATATNANNDASICEGESYQLNATGSLNYSWSPSAGLSNTTIPNPVATPTATTLYEVTGTDPSGCITYDEVLITVNPKPLITITNDTLVCQYSPVQLFASGGTTYAWSPSTGLNNAAISNPVATPSISTKYTVTVSSNSGCSAKDSLMLNVRKSGIFSINPSSAICINNSFQLHANGGDIYNWSPASNLSNYLIANPLASPSETTLYTVVINDTICHLTNTLSTTLTVNPLPVIIAAKSNDIDCSNNKIQLSVSGGVQYSWDPDPSLIITNIRNPVATPILPTLFKVTGTDANGCRNRDSIQVNFTATNKSQYLMPTAFTPNGDGLNDCYRIKYWGAILGLEFSIYNRWGERVYYSISADLCWDGTFKGVAQNPDTYVYMIKAKTICGETFRKGTFALIR